MKLSTSSSIFLATLALSSSTSTLAAPTGDAPESSLSVSASSSDMFDSSVHSVRHCSAHPAQPQPTPVEGQSALATRSDPSLVDTLIGAVGGLMLVGNPLQSILQKVLHSTLGVTDVEGGSTQNISSDDLAALQSAISEVNRALNNTISKVPSPVPSGLAPVVQNDFDPAGGTVSASPAPSASAASSAKAAAYPFAVVNDVPSSSSASPSASATPPSPPIPLNPPNTPALPTHIPI